MGGRNGGAALRDSLDLGVAAVREPVRTAVGDRTIIFDQAVR